MKYDAEAIKAQVSIETIVSHYGGTVGGTGKRVRCLCAERHTNGDADPSMTIQDGHVMCWSQQCFSERGADIFGVVGVMENLPDFKDQRERVMAIAGLNGHATKHTRKPRGTIVKDYVYTDEQGTPLHRTIRYDPKDFSQEHWDATRNQWVSGLSNVRRVLYHLPRVVAAQQVLVTEGEEDADAAEGLGWPDDSWASTTNPMGAEKWTDDYTAMLAGKTVLICPDNDEKGQAHLRKVAESCTKASLMVSVVRVPDGHKDLREWKHAGHTHEEFGRLLRAATTVGLGDDDFSLVTADTVQSKNTQWLLQGRIPLGMVTVLAGRAGLAKSTLAFTWGAQVTRGKAAGSLAGQPRAILVSSLEDTEAETMVPRFTVAQADLTKVNFIRLHRGGRDGTLTIPTDVDLLRRMLQRTQAALVLIDPFMGHVAAKLNSWNDQQLRQALTPLSRLAEECRVAILLVAHLNKDTTKEALDRIGGSGGTGNVARSVLFVGPDPANPDGDVKMLAQAKCNVGPKQATLRYQIEPAQFVSAEETIETTRIGWLGEAPGVNADDLVAKPDPLTHEQRRAAVDWLEEALPYGVRRKQKELEAEAQPAGINAKALWRAKDLLKVKSEKKGFYPSEWWWWRIDEAVGSDFATPDPKAPYKATVMESSTKTSPNPLKSSKAPEDSTGGTFGGSSTLEDSKNNQRGIFEESTNISNTYIHSYIEDSTRGTYTRPSGTPQPEAPSLPWCPCGGTTFWQGVDGSVACYRCQPPVQPDQLDVMLDLSRMIGTS